MEKKQGVLYPSNEKVLYISGEQPLRLLPRKLYQIINYCFDVLYTVSLWVLPEITETYTKTVETMRAWLDMRAEI